MPVPYIYGGKQKARRNRHNEDSDNKANEYAEGHGHYTVCPDIGSVGFHKLFSGCAHDYIADKYYDKMRQYHSRYRHQKHSLCIGWHILEACYSDICIRQFREHQYKIQEFPSFTALEESLHIDRVVYFGEGAARLDKERRRAESIGEFIHAGVAVEHNGLAVSQLHIDTGGQLADVYVKKGAENRLWVVLCVRELSGTVTGNHVILGYECQNAGAVF